jgi:hypothetical protein
LPTSYMMEPENPGSKWRTAHGKSSQFKKDLHRDAPPHLYSQQ